MKIPENSPDVWELLNEVGPGPLLRKILNGDPVDDKGRYLHWDEVRRRTPPAGLTIKQWWASMWLSRHAVSVQLPLTDTKGKPFRFSNVGLVQASAHRIDQQLGDHLLIDKRRSGEGLGGHRVASLIEEAITSSQLEGAVTTRPVAKEMLRTGRRPRDNSERMILNNYLAMQEAMEMAEDAGHLTIDGICSLHRVLTSGTLDDEQDAGRLQRPIDTRVAIYHVPDDQVLHTPPDAVQLPNRMKLLCQFANGSWVPTDGTFIHPLARAIILHFWLAYDHPFADGNGRTARALFYWSILRSKYGLAPYTSISSILRKASAQYAQSFLRVYSDDNDLTYFIVYQLSILERAIKALKEYIKRKHVEMSYLYHILSRCPQFNHRQQDAIAQAVRDPKAVTISAHSRYHRVSIQSARVDLLGLEELGLFTKTKSGRKLLFEPVHDLQKRISQLSSVPILNVSG